VRADLNDCSDPSDSRFKGDTVTVVGVFSSPSIVLGWQSLSLEIHLRHREED
jgi:hypothetical protein